MKKTYINPSMIVVRLSMNNIIATSPSPITIENNSGQATFVDGDAQGEAMTKGVTDINIWDDEW